MGLSSHLCHCGRRGVYLGRKMSNSTTKGRWRAAKGDHCCQFRPSRCRSTSYGSCGSICPIMAWSSSSDLRGRELHPHSYARQASYFLGQRLREGGRGYLGAPCYSTTNSRPDIAFKEARKTNRNMPNTVGSMPSCCVSIGPQPFDI